MNKTVKLALVGAGIGVIGLVVLDYIWWNHILFSSKSKKSSDPTDEKINLPIEVESPQVEAKLPLSKGDKGEAVKVAQKTLNAYIKAKFPNDAPIVVDGDFGNATEQAFMKYGNTKTVTKLGLKYMIDIIRKS